MTYKIERILQGWKFKKDILYVIIVGASWFEPSSMLFEIGEKLKKDFSGKLEVKTILLKETNKVLGVPICIFLKNNKILKKIAGIHSYKVFKKETENFLEGK